MARLYKLGQTAEAIEILLVSTTDGYTAVTGLGAAPVVTLSKAGAAYAPAAGAVSEVGNGVYKVAPNAGDFDTLGGLWVHATGTGAIPYDAEHQVVGFDPRDAVHFGLSALPNAAANAAGGLPISTAGALDLDDLAADVDATETRVTLALPSAAPQAAGGLITSTAGSLDLDELNADIEAIQTGVTVASYASGQDPATLLTAATAYLNAVADALLKRDWTSVTGEADRSALNALRALRNRWYVGSDNLLHVTEEDDTTDAWTGTASTDSSAATITGVDPT